MSCARAGAAIKPSAKCISVNGTIIPRETIAREAQYHPANTPAAAWNEAARALVIRQLLLDEARRLALEPAPLVDSEGRREADEEALVRQVIEVAVKTPVPDEVTCRRYDEQNWKRFRSPDIFEADHILFAALPADRDARECARADAAAVLAELNEHPEQFAELARAHSPCPSAAQGGNLGQITTGQTTPEFEQALTALAPGQLCAAPVATRYGFHVIRLDRKHEGQMLPYEAVAGHIADYLRESVRRRADAQYIARLVTAARIEGIELAGADALRVH